MPYGQPPYGQMPYPPLPYGQPLDYPSVRPPGYEYQPRVRTTNTLAIIGFVCSFFLCAILGLIFSIIGLSQIRHTGQRGTGLAIAGIAISGVTLIYVAAVTHIT
jgi:hypothetical protein